MDIKTNTGILLALASGLLLNLIFPRWEFDFLAWAALVPLLWALIHTQTAKRSFSLGLFAGWVAFSGSCFWITNTMVDYGGIPFALSVFLVFVLALYMALYVAVFSAGLFFFRSRCGTLAALALAPFLWTVLEYVRTYLFTGFPWNLLGCSQYKRLLVIQISDVTGVYGVSFFVCLINAFVVLCLLGLLTNKKDGAPNPHLSKRGFRLLSVFTVAVAVVVLSYGKFKIADYGQTNGDEPLKVSLIQADIPQERKWDTAYREEIMATYQRLSLSAPVDLVIWPETATPFVFNYHEELAARVKGFVKEMGTPLLMGSPSLEFEEDRKTAANSAYFISAQGEVMGRYDKIRLVPFGEYVPLKKILWFVEKMVTGIGEFKPGTAPVIFEHPRGKFGTLICFEIIFPSLCRQNVAQGATFLVNITNDAWFGKSAGPFQHLSQAVFRAVENRVPIARAANTGVSAVIDPTGLISSRTEIFTRRALIGVIHPATGERSFYTEHGDLFAGLCGIVILCSLGFCLYAERCGKVVH